MAIVDTPRLYYHRSVYKTKLIIQLYIPSDVLHRNVSGTILSCNIMFVVQCTVHLLPRYDHTRPKKTDRSSGNTDLPTASTSSTAHGTRQDKVTAKTRTTAKGVRPVVLPKDSTASHGSRMVTLKKSGHSSDSGLGDEPGSPMVKDPEQWVKATEFVPGQLWQGSGKTGHQWSSWILLRVKYRVNLFILKYIKYTVQGKFIFVQFIH